VNEASLSGDAGSYSADNLAPAFAVANLEAGTKWEAIRELLQKFEGHPGVVDRAAWESDLVRREKLQPTDVAEGVAFPHARTRAVREILWAIGTSREGISFQPGGPPTRLVVLIGVPESSIREYLEFLGCLSKKLRSAGMVDALLRCESGEQLLACFAEAGSKPDREE